MKTKLKVLTSVGARPEIIRLSHISAALEEATDHVLVHTGQNWDPNLDEIFFDDLDLRMPDLPMRTDPSSLGSMLGSVLQEAREALNIHPHRTNFIAWGFEGE